MYPFWVLDMAMKNTDKTALISWWKELAFSYQMDGQIDEWIQGWIEVLGENHESLHRVNEAWTDFWKTRRQGANQGKV